MLTPVQNVISSRIKEIHGKFSESDPFSIATRPCTTIVDDAEKLMRRQNATGIGINGVGDFNEQSLSITISF
jgi:hypothetical protein